MTDMPLSHVVYGTRDVEFTAARLRDEVGLEAVRGSRFPELGLADWFIPFEDQYVELLTVADDDVAARTPFGRWVSDRTAGGDHLLAWALEAGDDLDRVAQRLDLEPDALAFVDRTGVTRSSQLVGAARAFAEPCFPYFIAWNEPAEIRRGLAEASASIEHGSGARGIAWVEVSGDVDALSAWLDDGVDGGGIPVRVSPGEAGLLAVGLATSNGEVVLRAKD
ncbi:MAG TPA: VOC family protein [Solirubrobacteraceae bacterium]|nr:VOC family protein [Solirubrobacteraceae bacterium]